MLDSCVFSLSMAYKEVNMVENWRSNAYEGMSRRQFLAQMSAAGISLGGFAIAVFRAGGQVSIHPPRG